MRTMKPKRSACLFDKRHVGERYEIVFFKDSAETERQKYPDSMSAMDDLEARGYKHLRGDWWER